MLVKGQATAVDDVAAAVGLVAPAEIADTREETAAAGREAVGLAASELKTEDNAGLTDAKGYATSELTAEDKAGEPVTTASDSRVDRSEYKAGLAPLEAPTETPAGAAAAEVAASRKDDTAAADKVAEGVASIEISRDETPGATVTEGFAARKLSAEEAAALHSPAEPVAADATALRR